MTKGIYQAWPRVLDPSEVRGVMTYFGRFFLGGSQGVNFFIRQSEKPLFCLSLTKLTLI